MIKKLSAALIAMAMLLSVFSQALADGNPMPGFYNIGTAEGVEIRTYSSASGQVKDVNINIDGIAGNETFYPDSDSLRVTLVSTQKDAEYMLLLAERDESSDAGTVLFADQAAGGGRLSFNVFCALPERQMELLLYIGSDAEGFEPIAIPLYYMPADRNASYMKWDYDQCPRNYSCIMAGYSDLNPGEWYHNGIHYVLDRGIMNGYDKDRFGPADPTSRAMIVTMLWRMEGSPASEGEHTFRDVPEDMWYSEAVRWAASENIVGGYSAEAFGRDDAISREQLAAILWRYAVYKGDPADGYSGGELEVFADADRVSGWASDAMCWAVAVGIMTGTGSGVLAPSGNAGRAQVATMIMRFCTK